jgi:hypothetical protein
MKKTILFGAVVIMVLGALFLLINPKATSQTGVKEEAKDARSEESVVDKAPSNERIANPDTELADPNPRDEVPPVVPLGKLKVANFTGTLEKVDVGCFADSECFVEVDGKHITAIMGWSQAVVGSVQGVDGFGDLENHIGKEVEVYAQDLSDGTYTLYGNEGFYIKLK